MKIDRMQKQGFCIPLFLKKAGEALQGKRLWRKAGEPSRVTRLFGGIAKHFGGVAWLPETEPAELGGDSLFILEETVSDIWVRRHMF